VAGGVREDRPPHRLIKLEGNKYRTQAPHGTVIQVRYNPFDLSAVWRYEGVLPVAIRRKCRRAEIGNQPWQSAEELAGGEQLSVSDSRVPRGR
jgi:hypothetical protein